MKNITRLLSVIVIMCMLCTSAYAAVSVTAGYDAKTDKITLKGDLNGDAIMRILPFGKDESSLSDGSKPIDIRFFRAKGAYTYEANMPLTAPSGKYSVFVTDENGAKATDTFIYYVAANAGGILEDINDATSGTEIYNIVNSDAAGIGIDKDDSDFANYSVGACDILYELGMQFEENADGVAEFNKVFFACIALSAMKDADDSKVSSYLKLYEDNLEINYLSDYENNTALSDDMKSDILSLYSSLNYVDELKSIKAVKSDNYFNELYKRILAISAVRNAGDGINLKKVVTDTYKTTIGNITAVDGYNEDNSVDVFSAMNGNADKCLSFADIGYYFSEAVKSVNGSVSGGTTTTKPSRPSGSVTTPSGSVNKSDKYENIPSVGDSGTDVGTGTPSVIKTSYKIPTLSSGTASYWDMPAEHWAYESIAALSSSGIISGYEDGSYRGDNFITRAEFTKLIVSAFAIEAPEGMEFADVSADSWYAPYVAKGAGSGLINGYDGSFNPDGNISRQDSVLIMYRMAQLAGINYNGGEFSFNDMDSIALYAITAVQGLGNAGIVNGDTFRNFNPANNLTRQEAAKLLYGLINDMAVKASNN